jgi:hypothetical protein
MVRAITLTPARSVDGRDGYFVDLGGIQAGAIWLPKGPRGRTYTAQAYQGEQDTARVATLGQAIDHVIHRCRNV